MAAAADSAARSRRHWPPRAPRCAVVSRPGAGLEAQADAAGWAGRRGRPLDTGRTGRGRRGGRPEPWGGLDLLVVNSGGPPPGRFEDLDEAAWLRAIDGTLLSTAPAPPSGPAAPSPGPRPGDPDHPVELGPRTDPGPVDLEPHPTRPGRPPQVAGRGDRPDPDQRPRAGPRRDRSHRPARYRARRTRPVSTSRRSSAGRSSGSRSGVTAIRPNSGGSGRSCCRRPRPT